MSEEKHGTKEVREGEKETETEKERREKV